MRIGRDPGCEICFPGDSSLSRRHALLRRHGTTLVIEDLGSRNGTWVDGERIHYATVLAGGEQIHVGAQVLKILGTAAPSKPFADELPLRLRNTDPTDEFDEDTGVQPIPPAVMVTLDVGGQPTHGERDTEYEPIVLAGLLKTLRNAPENHVPSSRLLQTAAKSALRRARQTRDGTWVDYVIELYEAAQEAMPAPVLAALEPLLWTMRGIDVALVGRYTRMLEKNRGPLGSRGEVALARFRAHSRALDAARRTGVRSGGSK